MCSLKRFGVLIKVLVRGAPKLVWVALVHLDVPKRALSSMSRGAACSRESFGTEGHPPPARAAEGDGLSSERGLHDGVPLVIVDDSIRHAAAPLVLPGQR